MVYEHLNYRAYLKDVLAEKTTKNSRFSLRALASQWGFSHSTLSEVMKGSANLSLESARKIASRLSLTPNETEYLCLLVQFEASKNPEVRESLLARLKSLSPKKSKIHDLSVDQFKQISEWYHSAILEMTQLHKFELTAASVAKKLKISKIEADAAIERLIRLELLEKDSRGRLVLVHNRLLTQTNAVTNEAMRKFLRQMLQKASDALENQNTKERVSGYETLPFSKEALPEAREIIEKCFSDMVTLGRRYPIKKDVYHLAVHFFNLTTGKE